MTANLNQPDGSIKSDSSPSPKRKGLSSSPEFTIRPSPLHSNCTVELNVLTSIYEVEPKRAGLQSPDPTNLERIAGNMSTNTFIHSSTELETV